MRRILISVLMMTISSLAMAVEHVANYQVVPKPNSIDCMKGRAFILDGETLVII